MLFLFQTELKIKKGKNRTELAQFLTTLNSLKHLDLHETGICFFIQSRKKNESKLDQTFSTHHFYAKKASRLRCFIDI